MVPPLLAFLLAAAAPPLPAALNDAETTEGWIWQRAQAGDVADLNIRCGTLPLDIHKRDDAGWSAPCRRVDPVLLRALLTQPDLADHTPHGVRIIGARIDGDLDLEDALVRTMEVVLDRSWISSVDLNDARLEGALSLNGTLIDGRLTGQRAFISSVVLMDGAVFSGPVDLHGAHVEGEIGMVGASIADHQTFEAELLDVGELYLSDARLGGPVDLRGAQVKGQMAMVGASIAAQQKFDAEYLHVGAAGLLTNNAKFGGPVDLSAAHVEGQIAMEGVSVADHQAFVAELLHAGTLILSNTKFGGPIDLRSAHVEGQILMLGGSIAVGQTFGANLLHAGTLFLRDVQFGGPIDLVGARIDSEMDMDGATIGDQQIFDAELLQVGRLFLSQVKFGGPVTLNDAHADGEIFMDAAAVASQQPFAAERLHVGGSLFARSATFGGAVNFQTAIIDGDLDLRDSHVRLLDLSGAAVRDNLRFGGEGPRAIWDACGGPATCLNLRNAKIGNLQVDEQAWPPRITLEGFSYTHLGGIGGEQRQDMRDRPIRSWRRWLKRDPVYSTQPYAQLASVLTAAGNRDGAADIRYFGRDRERSELLGGCQWALTLGLVEKPDDSRPCGWRTWGTWLGQSALQLFVGYGIGVYSFRAAGWALLLAFAGTAILCFAPGVRGVKPSPLSRHRGKRQRSVLWCFGASLNRVLPLVTISPEFNDFFNDPKRERLRPAQHVAFAVLAIGGWALGLFVAAAFSGLIQS
jgi:hypothetical protein